MKIAIVGAGAMGSLYGAMLSVVADVYLFSTNNLHMNVIKNKGLLIYEPEGYERLYRLFATSKLTSIEDVDLAIIFVKSYATKEAAEEALSILKSDGLLMTLQNGLGNADVLVDVAGDRNRVLCGVTTFGATLERPGRVRMAGRGYTKFGPLGDLSSRKLEQIREIFEKAGLRPEIVSEPYRVLWEKLFVNVVINPLTAILRVENGEIAKNSELKSAARLLVKEACEVADVEGYKFSPDDVFEHVISVADTTSQNSSSMLQDILNRKKTEIESINGEVVRRAKEHGINTPANELVLNIIRFLEEKGL